MRENNKIKTFLVKFKYPKLFFFALAIVLAFFIFRNPLISNLVTNLGELKYLGIFFAGILFSFGFSSPFSVGFFIVSNPSNIFLAALVGGLGALIADLFIFSVIRFSFMDEFEALKKTKTLKKLIKIVDKNIELKIKNYLLFAIAGIVIASPLPDEIGVSMLAGLTRIKTHILSIVSFTLNTLGIFIILLLSLK